MNKLIYFFSEKESLIERFLLFMQLRMENFVLIMRSLDFDYDTSLVKVQVTFLKNGTT